MTTAPQEAHTSCQQVVRDHLVTWLHRTRNSGRPGRRLPQPAHIDLSAPQPITIKCGADPHAGFSSVADRLGKTGRSLAADLIHGGSALSRHRAW